MHVMLKLPSVSGQPLMLIAHDTITIRLSIRSKIVTIDQHARQRHKFRPPPLSPVK